MPGEDPIPRDATPTTTRADGAAVDPGLARAGAAAAARRRELDISQRSLAAAGVLNAGALIAFEKGRSWPREATRAKLERVLRWPPGTLHQLRTAAADDGADEGTLIADAVVAAVATLGTAVAALPPVDDPAFPPRVAAILANLRQLEAVAVRATRLGRVTPTLLRALSAVRGRRDELTARAATAPHATLGQRLYAARRRADLTVAETARAAGVADDVVTRVESEQPVPAAAATALGALLDQFDCG